VVDREKSLVPILPFFLCSEGDIAGGNKADGMPCTMDNMARDSWVGREGLVGCPFACEGTSAQRFPLLFHQ